MKKTLTIAQIAIVCHEANRALCQTIDDSSQKPWYEAEEWQKESAIKGVQWRIENPDAPASAQHEAWLADKENDGWKYGPVKNAETKEHPCFIPYDQLPEEQKAKDALFVGIVKSLLPLLPTEVGEQREIASAAQEKASE